jgi:hypothetical protein
MRPSWTALLRYGIRPPEVTFASLLEKGPCDERRENKRDFSKHTTQDTSQLGEPLSPVLRRMFVEFALIRNRSSYADELQAQRSLSCLRSP